MFDCLAQEIFSHYLKYQFECVVSLTRSFYCFVFFSLMFYVFLLIVSNLAAAEKSNKKKMLLVTRYDEIMFSA